MIEDDIIVPSVPTTTQLFGSICGETSQSRRERLTKILSEFGEVFYRHETCEKCGKLEMNMLSPANVRNPDWRSQLPDDYTVVRATLTADGEWNHTFMPIG